MSYMNHSTSFALASGIQELSFDEVNSIFGGESTTGTVATHVATVATIVGGVAVLSGNVPVAVGAGFVAGVASIIAAIAD